MGAAHPTPVPPARVAGPATAGAGDLTALLRYERDQAAQPLLEALLDRRSSPDDPADARQAAERVLRAHAPWALDLAGSAAKLIERAGDERRVRLFRGWAFGGRTLEELASQEGMIRQGASWNARQAGVRIRQAAAKSPPWSWLVSTARSRLGALTSASALEAETVRLGVTTAPEAELLAWLAGPYRPVAKRPGWLAIDPRPVVERTAECLAGDGGVRRRADVEAELAELDIRPDQLAAWLGANGSTLIHDLAVKVTGPMADAIERVLDAHGAPRSFAQIGADLAAGGRPVEPSALARAVRAGRFSRSGPGVFGLAVWGVEPAPAGGSRPAGRARPPADPVPAGSQEAPPDRAARARATPATADRGRATPAKAARATPAKADRSRATPAKAGRARPGATPAVPAPVAEARLWLWLRVDEEVLRGGEAAVPAALVEGLGLAPHSRRTFSSRWGPVTLAHDGARPSRGSVRAIALAAGANADDTLLLGFDVAGDVAVELRRGPAQLNPPAGGAEPLVLFPELEYAHGGTP